MRMRDRAAGRWLCDAAGDDEPCRPLEPALTGGSACHAPWRSPRRGAPALAVVGGLRRRRDRGAEAPSLGVAVELQDVAGRAHQRPLALRGGEAPAHEPADATVLLRLAEDRLDGARPPAVGGGPSSVRSRCSIASSALAPSGAAPVVVPISRAARRCFQSLEVAIRRSGPGAVALASDQ